MRQPLSNEAFADWCDKQPPKKRYKYVNGCTCAFAQYLGTIGITKVFVDYDTWAGIDLDGRFRIRRLPAGLDDAVRQRPQTFGALTERLRAGD